MNSTAPYVRRRSDVNGNEKNSSLSIPSTLISVTSSSVPPSANITVTTTSNVNDESKKRINRDEEAEAQRKHRSAQARRERRSTQSVTLEDIKAAEQQIKFRSNDFLNELSNNQIGAPSTPLPNHQHHIQTQQIIKNNKDQIKSETTTTNQSHRNPFIDHIPTITANDSLNLPENQQQRRRNNRINYLRKNTGNIIWNDQTKQIQIKDQQQINTFQSTTILSNFENNSTNHFNNGFLNQQSFHQINRNIQLFNENIIQLEKDILDRDQIIDKLVSLNIYISFNLFLFLFLFLFFLNRQSTADGSSSGAWPAPWRCWRKR